MDSWLLGRVKIIYLHEVRKSSMEIPNPSVWTIISNFSPNYLHLNYMKLVSRPPVTISRLLAAALILFVRLQSLETNLEGECWTQTMNGMAELNAKLVEWLMYYFLPDVEVLSRRRWYWIRLKSFESEFEAKFNRFKIITITWNYPKWY